MADIRQTTPPVSGASPRKGATADETLSVPPNAWDRMIADWQRRPRFWMTSLFTAGIVVLAGLLGARFFSSRTAEEAYQRGSDLQKALQEQDATEKAARIGDLLSRFSGDESEPYVTWLHAKALKDAGDKAEDPAEKIRHFQGALDSAEKLRSKWPASTWAALPLRPSPQPGAAPAETPAARLAEYCRKQVAWLQARQLSVAEEPDSGATAKITLQDPDGKDHVLDVKFFSKDAPYAVDAFFDLARQGFFDGTLVFGLERDDPNTEENHAVHLGSAMSKVAPDKPDTWGGEKDFIGYTLPSEDSRLKPKKGRLAFEARREANVPVGQNPVDIVLYTMDPRFPKQDRVVFAEVTGADEILSSLQQIPGKKDSQITALNPARVFLPEKNWKVSKIAVEGQPANPPARPLARKLTLPEAPPKPDTPKEEPKGDVKPPEPEKK